MITSETKTPAKKWRVAETGTPRDEAAPYPSQTKAYEAVHAITAARRPVTVWRFQNGRWWTWEKLNSSGQPT